MYKKVEDAKKTICPRFYEAVSGILIATIIILTAVTAVAGESNQLSPEQRTNNFNQWIKDKNNHAEVYFIPQNTFTSRSRETYVKVFNRVQAQGGSYKKYQIKKWGCDYFNSWSVGRLIETTPDSMIVKMEYRVPHSNNVNYGWVHFGVIETMDSRRSRVVR